MSFKKRAKKREKRFMTPQERRLRRMMVEHDVTQVEIAKEMDIPESNVTYYLRSLTPSKVTRLENLIISLAKAQAQQKAASGF